jgi:hypothetical protein
MMDNVRFYVLSLMFLVAFSCLNAQLPDEVKGTPSFIAEIIKNYDNENAMAFEVNHVSTTSTLTIQVHIIKNIKGLTGVNVSDVYNSITSASSYFQAIGITFKIASVDTIYDYHYSFIAYDKNKTELLTKYASANKINLFLVDSIRMGTDASYGFTYFPDAPDSNVIFLDKKYIKGVSLSAMLGHYFGLLSTHETAGGSELASEKNCAKSGDFICDTYADPDLYQLVDSNCNYTGTARDSLGKYYVPTVSNIMSNSLYGCKCVFTPLQYRRMYYYYLRRRQYLK